MVYLTLLVLCVAIIIFSGQIVVTLKSTVKGYLRIILLLYFATLLLWQITALAIFFTVDIDKARILYQVYTMVSTGFIFFFLPLAFFAGNHKKKEVIFFITVIFYLINIVINITYDPITSLRTGKLGFYIPEFKSSIILLNLIPIIFFLGGITHCIIGLVKIESAVSRQRLKYFLTSSFLIFVGLSSNLTRFQDYPVDILCAMLGGVILAYAVLTKKLLNIRKTFFRGAINATLLTALNGIYLLLTLLYTSYSGKNFPFYTIFPVMITFSLFMAMMFMKDHKETLSFYGRLNFSARSVYRNNLRNYYMLIKQELNLYNIFESLFKTLDADFSVTIMSVRLFDNAVDGYRLEYKFGDHQLKDDAETISRYSNIKDIFNIDDVIILDNLEEEIKLIVSNSLPDTFNCGLPDIIQILRVADETAGFICLQIKEEEKRFFDVEDFEYLRALNSYTSDAVARAFAHEQLKKDVSHKENLIKDINHRVKNNLQMISGLLAMQELTSEHEESRTALSTARNRVETIAKVHELLYIGGVVDAINISDYLNEIISSLKSSAASKEISFRTNIPEVMLETEKALTFCMVVNELISNSVKYAFTDRKSGNIDIDVWINDGIFNCRIKDDGIGFTAEKDAAVETTGLGHNLVKTFIEKQLKGSWIMKENDGTEHSISFPIKADNLLENTAG